MTKPKSRQAEHTEDTRSALVGAARDLFTANGYADTSIEEIVAAARVTRGSLYHHFASKEDLFRAVLSEVAAEAVGAKSASESTVGSFDDHVWSWEEIKDGMRRYLDICLQPGYRQIMLVDGPAVLGFDECLETAEKNGLSQLETHLHRAVDQKLIDDIPVKPLAHLLSGLVSNAAFFVGRAKDTRRARKDVLAVFDHLMDGLLLDL